MTTSTLCLGIPTINRKDLLDEALVVYLDNWRKRHIFIIDNGNQGFQDNPPYFKVWTPPNNIGVASSWNKIIERAKVLGYSHVMILNDDVVVQKDPYDIEKFIDENPADIYTGLGYFSFIIPIATYDKIGGFDENYYPAYYEDTDYDYRLKCAEMKILDTDFLLPEVMRVSQSGQKDKSLYDKVFECRKYYESKWGGSPTQEKYKKPFNNEE
jgi:GT2 family glycosyltransferase